MPRVAGPQRPMRALARSRTRAMPSARLRTRPARRMAAFRKSIISGPLMMAFLKAAARRAGRIRQLADGVARVRDRIL